MAVEVLASQTDIKPTASTNPALIPEWHVELIYTHVLEDYACYVVRAPTLALALSTGERMLRQDRASQDSPRAGLTVVQRYAEPRRRRRLTLPADWTD